MASEKQDPERRSGRCQNIGRLVEGHNVGSDKQDGAWRTPRGDNIRRSSAKQVEVSRTGRGPNIGTGSEGTGCTGRGEKQIERCWYDYIISTFCILTITMNFKYPPPQMAPPPMASTDFKRSEQIFRMRHQFFLTYLNETIRYLSNAGSVPNWRQVLRRAIVS